HRRTFKTYRASGRRRSRKSAMRFRSTIRSHPRIKIRWNVWRNNICSAKMNLLRKTLSLLQRTSRKSKMGDIVRYQCEQQERSVTAPAAGAHRARLQHQKERTEITNGKA